MNKGVLHVFSEVAHQYELVNHVLTFGLDIPWRKRAARVAAAGGGTLWLEVCSGTGEMAVNLVKYASPDTKIVVSDFSLPMLSRAKEKQELKGTVISLADSMQLPFSSDTFDLIIISFATRNITPNRNRLTDFLREFHRVLKPGGRFINLETSQPSFTPFRIAFRFYTKQIIKIVGRLISGSKTGYAYLAHTVPRFFNAEELKDILFEAGFSKVNYTTMTFGAVAVHRAVK
ncbi:MAG: ubiquinone/menaquinone biosynthesis methyltransferase [Candidatus Thorarchaeota archaeon]|jgi:demethylmenaquinone methyltransferase/2-methoxy-6-polyprenyl-1,4-benzoquinol methylase